MRWKAFFYDKNRRERNNEEEEKESDGDAEEKPNINYGFKSPRTPPQNNLLKAFEDDLYDIIQKVSFTKHRNDFQKKLKSDIQTIRSSTKLFVPADKSTNLYEMDRTEYERLLHGSITKSYKKCHTNVKATIDSEAKYIASSLSLGDRIEQFSEKDSFITLKDHKENFQNHPTCRLINPAKSEMGHISKSIIEQIVSEVAKSSGLNQWRNTSVVIEWFKGIPRKSQARLMKFDICDFYPSITEDLLLRAIEFARTFVDISDEYLNIIMHTRKCLLFSGNEQWVKKEGNELFDVTMGSFDGAEVCELVGLYLLSKIDNALGNGSVGLYRDDGLAVIRSTSGRVLDRLRKDIIDIFKAEELSITCETNLSVADFLDVTFNMTTGKFHPYRKDNNKPLYISMKSNHPKNIKEELPSMINNRLSDLSCDEEAFNRSKGLYEAALQDSGFQHDLKFEPQREKRRRNRNRKVIWYNPPFSSHVKTDIGRKFLKLIDKHFPREHTYAKIFNRSTLKLSYSCMPNMATIIKNHNNCVLKPPAEEQGQLCNCRNVQNCPLGGECLTKCLVYLAEVTAERKDHIYYGLTDGTFKKRFDKHTHSFRHREQRTSTELSKFVWDLNDRGIPYSIKWSIVAKTHPYVCGSGRCDLCLTEKLHIARSNHERMLNSRSEILSKCRHKNKYLLQAVRN